MSAPLLRIAVRGPATTLFRANPIRTAPLASRVGVLPSVIAGTTLPSAAFSTTQRMPSEHKEETFEEFTSRFEKEFEQVNDVFELQRNLNNAFAYDLVPAPSVIEAALRASRRVNDFATAVRVFEALKAKVENEGQYKQYLEELKPLREELGIVLKENLYPESK